MARPSRKFDHAPGTPQSQLLVAATTGNLALLERMARKLDGGRGRLAETVEAVRDRGVGALHLAAGNNKAEVCEFLVEDVRVDVNAIDLDDGYVDVVRYLLQHGANPDHVDKRGFTPLHEAVKIGGSVDIIRYLLEHGANPDHVNKRGLTPLHEAVKIGHCEIVELLLSRGAYVDPFSTSHGTPLHVAAEFKQDGAMKILLDHHANCNKILDSYRSPLMIAIFSSSVKCVNLLLEAGADVKGIRTATPLQAAARSGLTDVLKPVLNAGADPNVLNEFSHLPIQLAAYYGTRKDVEILFEVTSSRIPAVHDWSVDGIISYVKSEPKVEDHPLSKMSVAELREEGNKAMHKQDYKAALEFYNVAMMLDPENVDSVLISNRGFCQLNMGYGEGALTDAHACRAMRPGCAHSCWLQGYSYMLLKDYEKACDSFLDGLKLKPGFVGIEKALREALRLLKESHADEKKGLKGQRREAHFYL